jgi:TetR/AcrR family transcriptional regulator
MAKVTLSTEEQILEAAKKVFHRKGFEGTRMQEIADEAGFNKSLVHYYFRNKENLFQAVFEDAFSSLAPQVAGIFSGNSGFEEKITRFTGLYLTFIHENSFVPWFIINGLYEKPDQLGTIFKKTNVSPKALLDSIRKQVKREFGADIDPLHLYINILSLCIFPVIARPLIAQIFEYTDEEMAGFYEQRKSEVPLFIINSIKEFKKKNPPKK